jgi:hypothetical protein
MESKHTTRLHEKSMQKNKPLCLHFDRFWHWKPGYYYIYWTLFSAHCLCYIHIDTTSSACAQVNIWKLLYFMENLHLIWHNPSIGMHLGQILIGLPTRLGCRYKTENFFRILNKSLKRLNSRRLDSRIKSSRLLLQHIIVYTVLNVYIRWYLKDDSRPSSMFENLDFVSFSVITLLFVGDIL